MGDFLIAVVELWAISSVLVVWINRRVWGTTK
jgi:hypothetical protein